MPKRTFRLLLAGIALAAVVAGLGAVLHFERAKAPPPSGFELVVEDSQNRALPCRVHLEDQTGKLQRPAGWPAFDDHFVFSGSALFKLAVGKYSYEIERGPEYRPARGSFEVARNGGGRLALTLERLVDLAALGWYSGELHIHRPVKDVPLLARAEDLHVAPVVTWWNDPASAGLTLSAPAEIEPGRFVDATVGEDERQAGALLYFRMKAPLALPGPVIENGAYIHRHGDPRDEYPTHSALARQARTDPQVHIDIEKPFWWDTPTWVALGLADSLGIANNHMTRRGRHDTEAWGKARDPAAYGGPFGNAFFSQDLYYRLLDAGIRIAPSAGSASGVLQNPVGHNRVYVHTGAPLAYDAWWQGLKAGRSFVTNGPLLLVEANGQDPGHVFQSDGGRPLEFVLSGRLWSNDEIARVEVVRDGKVAERAEYDAAAQTLRFRSFTMSASGWFLVRAISARTDVFSFASTAPFYVEIGPNTRRISRAAVTYWAAWVNERIGLMRAAGASSELASMLEPQVAAARFWQEQLARANAD